MTRTLLAVALCLGTVLPSPAQQPVDFQRDVRPILSDACFHCHGPDPAQRKAKLDLSTKAGSRSDRGEGAAIAPGKPHESLAIQRMLDTDPKRRMPPANSGLSITPEQIAKVKAWIAAGAEWPEHWAFVTPQRPALPAVKNEKWARNPIDRFILMKLEKEGLTPSNEADRVTWLRRVSFDLTGLPPMPAEIDAFVADNSADAYEKVVGRLLKSPRYGERMAIRWLDAARYADTHGYQTDGPRIMWRWRDWVIDAFNANMPFDQFTVEQLAGDLLPNATLEQKLATGFNRNHRGNSEGGIVPEEYAVEYVADRVDTTATVWLALTMACARCHNHKYDPISQLDFYRLFAFFNSIAESGRAIKFGNSPPYLKTPTKMQADHLTDLRRRRDRAKKRYDEMDGEIRSGLGQWEEIYRGGDPDWAPSRHLVAHLAFDELPKDVQGPLELVSGKKGKAIHLTGGHAELGDVGNFGFFDKFTLSAWVRPDDAKQGTILSRMIDTDRGEGYHVYLKNGVIAVDLSKRLLDDAIRIETTEKLSPNEWQHLAITYDGSRVADGVKVYLDSKQLPVKVHLDALNQTFEVKASFRIGIGSGPTFRGKVDEVRIYKAALSGENIALLAERATMRQILGIPPDARSPVQQRLLREFWVDKLAPPAIREARDAWLKAEEEVVAYDESLPTTMVMQELPQRRETHLLLRGEYDKKGPRVEPAVPAKLSPPKGTPRSRLDLAQWLVDRNNPLTARVAVNRLWQMVFGTGLVKTVEDFGAQGEAPSHPELLDWLAVEFMEPTEPGAKAWDMQRMLRLMTTSATYRQSSKMRPELLKRDPENRLLARGPRLRLSADMIRDQALYASGLLTEKLGGPSIKPYQPPGLQKELHGVDDDEREKGPNLYRRSLYVYWKRTVAPPALTTLDAGTRESCVVRETRTNTPLQALNLLNDVVYVEAARNLAQRAMKEGGAGDPDRLAFAFRLALSRKPSDAELEILQTSLAKHRAHYRANAEAARKLLAVGDSLRDASLDPAEHAAFAAVANSLLNLDEAITKE